MYVNWGKNFIDPKMAPFLGHVTDIVQSGIISDLATNSVIFIYFFALYFPPMPWLASNLQKWSLVLLFLYDLDPLSPFEGSNNVLHGLIYRFARCSHSSNSTASGGQSYLKAVVVEGGGSAGGRARPRPRTSPCCPLSFPSRARTSRK